MKQNKADFQVLNYEYLNTGGNTMVGIFTVWLPKELKTVYAMTNEEGCNLSVVDYISNDLGIDNYDELIIDTCDFGRLTGREKYFELYRHCLNEYTKSDCRYFNVTRAIPYHLLSDELQKAISADYFKWCVDSGYELTFYTDGDMIILHSDYETPEEVECKKKLQDIKDFKSFHDTTACVEAFYDEEYVLTFSGKTIRLPFMADVWDAVDTMLRTTIENW